MDVTTLTAVEIRDGVQNGRFTATEIIHAYLARIEAVDPQVGAFLRVLKVRALAQAAAVDAKRERGETLGRLAGVPVGIKDNIHIAGELSTCASNFLTNYRAPFAATVVERIEAEDGICIGKTNLDEFAMGSTTEHSALGNTRNPWNLDCVPGGSSGGSAAAVAARLCPVSLGSDTGGSIRQPASFCGIVGFKPSYGRVSRFGLVAFGSSLDQIGPFATTVEDATLMLEVMGGHDSHDATSLPQEIGDLRAGLRKSLAGVRIGVPFSALQKQAGRDT